MALTNRPACLRGAGKAVVLEVSLGTTARKYYRKEKTHYDFKTTPPEARTQSPPRVRQCWSGASPRRLRSNDICMYVLSQ